MIYDQQNYGYADSQSEDEDDVTGYMALRRDDDIIKVPVRRLLEARRTSASDMLFDSWPFKLRPKRNSPGAEVVMTSQSRGRPDGGQHERHLTGQSNPVQLPTASTKKKKKLERPGEFQRIREKEKRQKRLQNQVNISVLL